MVATLQAHGFAARPERRQCASGTVANISNGGPDNDRVLREGHVICLVREGPSPNAALQRHDDGDKVGWSVANVNCAVYFSSEDKEVQVGRLGAAMRELAQMAG